MMNWKKALFVSLVVLAATILILPAAWQGPQPAQAEPGQSNTNRAYRGPCGGWPSISSEDVIEVMGKVTEVDMGRAQGTPTIKVDQQEIVVSPYPRWLNEEFEVSVGDQVTVRAFPSTVYTDALVAIEITKSDGSSLVLRGEDGGPLAGQGRRARRGRP